MVRKLPEWAQFIIGQALADIKKVKDAEEIREKLRGTALGVNSWMMKVADDLIDKKVKLLQRRANWTTD